MKVKDIEYQRQLMLITSDDESLMFNVGCDCKYMPEHAWTLEFKADTELPVIELEITSNDRYSYMGLWRRIKAAYSLVFKKISPTYASIMMGTNQIEAFKKALQLSEEYFAEWRSDYGARYSTTYEMLEATCQSVADMEESIQNAERLIDAYNHAKEVCPIDTWHDEGGLVVDED